MGMGQRLEAIGRLIYFHISITIDISHDCQGGKIQIVHPGETYALVRSWRSTIQPTTTQITLSATLKTGQ